MACLIKRDTSPYWLVQYRSAKTGRKTQKSTKCRVKGTAAELRKAQQLCAALSKRESEECREKVPHDQWEKWVPLFIPERYRGRALTRIRYENAWSALSVYLAEIGVDRPVQLTYEHCVSYPKWRSGRPMAKKKAAGRNTALLEVKFLGVLMQEAVRRNFASANPCIRLGMKRDKPKEKPELTVEQIRTIRLALKTEEAWMRNAFDIAICHGVRLRETDVFMEDVDLQRGVIHFRKTKGDKPFSAAIHPALLPLFRMLKRKGAERACGLPKNPAKPFYKLFRKLGIDASFHSTRVTVASRLARAGIPTSQAMAYVNHSSELIHRTYQRLNPQDLVNCHAALSLDKPSQPGNKGGRGARPRRVQE